MITTQKKKSNSRRKQRITRHNKSFQWHRGRDAWNEQSRYQDYQGNWQRYSYFPLIAGLLILPYRCDEMKEEGKENPRVRVVYPISNNSFIESSTSVKLWCTLSISSIAHKLKHVHRVYLSHIFTPITSLLHPLMS